jgi:hypothetical protein
VVQQSCPERKETNSCPDMRDRLSGKKERTPALNVNENSADRIGIFSLN